MPPLCEWYVEPPSTASAPQFLTVAVGVQAAPIDISQDSTFSRVPKCHIMLLYSIGFSLVMTRRFANASQLFSRVLLYFHRTRQYV